MGSHFRASILRAVVRGGLAACLLAVVVPAGPSASATAASTTIASTSLAPAEEVSLSGGDLITLPRPVVLRAPAKLGSAWSTLEPPSTLALPGQGVGALLLQTTSSSASRTGSVQVRAVGSPSAGVSALRYGTGASQGLTLVKVGTRAGLGLRSTGGSPVTTVSLLGWIPETATLTVPEVPAAEQVRSLGRTAQKIPVTGLATSSGEVPADATSVVVALRSKAQRSGTFASWTTGTATPATGEMFPRGETTVVRSLRPGGDGTISMKTLSGSTTLGVRVLGWTGGGTTVTPLAGISRLTSASPGGLRPFALRGAGGVPADARHTWLSVSAPAGATVKLWTNPTGQGQPVHTWRSRGSAVSLLVPAPASGARGALRVSGTTRSTTVAATGYGTTPPTQEVTMTPKPGTHLLGAGDVESRAGTTLVLVPSAGTVQPGDHVLVQTPDGLPLTVRVDAVSTAADGRQTIVVSDVPLSEALADLEISYHDPADGTAGRVANGRVAALAGGGGGGGLLSGLGLKFFKEKPWSCTGGFDPAALIVEATMDGSVNFDLDLSEGVFDFSLRGGITTRLGLDGDASISCTFSGDVLPMPIPIPGTPVAVKLAGTASLALTPGEGGRARIVVTNTRRFFAAYYKPGWGAEPVSDATITSDGGVDAEADGGGLQLQVGVQVGVGPALVEAVGLSGEVSLTVGTEVNVGAPDPAKDPLGRTLRGPGCLDASMNPYAEFGGSLMVPFFKDLTVNVARFEFDPLVFYRGPCVGYSGTIKLAYAGHGDHGAFGCTAQSCPARTWEVSGTKTLIPQMANFARWYDWTGAWGSPVVQPYTWTYQNHSVTKDYVPKTYDGQVSELCTWTRDVTGSGTVDWPTSEEPATHAYVFEGYGANDQPGMRWSVPATATQQTQVTGDPYWCGEGSTDTVPVESWEAYGGEELAGAMSTLEPQINVTLTGHVQYHPEWQWTLTANLTRQSFSRG